MLEIEKEILDTQKKNEELEEKLFLLRGKELALRTSIAIKTAEIECPHIAGSSILSVCRDILGKTSIAWHQLNSSAGGTIVGVCLLCNRQFRPEDLDYTYWRSKPSFCRISKAGKQEPIGPDENVDEEIKKQFTNFKEKGIDLEQVQTWGANYFEEFLQLSPEELDKKSDFEIRKVMEYVREKRKKEKESANVPSTQTA
jgi:hypothetical protein